MRIETFGKDVEVTPALQSYVEEKLARIGKHFDQHCEARVTLKLQKTEHHVDASLNIPGRPCTPRPAARPCMPRSTCSRTSLTAWSSSTRRKTAARTAAGGDNGG